MLWHLASDIQAFYFLFDRAVVLLSDLLLDGGGIEHTTFQSVVQQPNHYYSLHVGHIGFVFGVYLWPTDISNLKFDWSECVE